VLSPTRIITNKNHHQQELPPAISKQVGDNTNLKQQWPGFVLDIPDGQLYTSVQIKKSRLPSTTGTCIQQLTEI